MSKTLEPITSLEQELELRIEWLENGLKEIANGRDDMNGIHIKQQAQSILDGEPTTADEHNAKAKIELEKVNKGLNVLTSGMDALAKDKKYVRISDVNKEISKEWNRDREEKINMVTSIGHKGDE
tara:strand:- start:42 stop:416 length:375 start_codon:yes stop_codon:yes gene_type:complete